MKQRNGVIDFMRFIFALLVILHHAILFHKPIIAGYIGVEFFFMVTGWLMAEKQMSSWGGQLLSLRAFFHKTAGFYPEYLIATLVSYILYTSFMGEQSLFSLFSDLFLLQMFGFPAVSFTGTMWYLSAMMIAFPIMSVALEYIDRRFPAIGIIVVLTIYGGYAFRYHMVGTVLDPLAGGFLQAGVLRAIAGMWLGVLLHHGSLYLRQQHLTKWGTVILTILEIFGYVGTIYLAIHFRATASVWDFVMTVLIALAVCISFSKKSYLFSLFQHYWVNVLGVFSLNLFLNHFYFGVLVKIWFPTLHPDKQLIIYILCAFLCSFVNLYLAKCLRTILQRAGRICFSLEQT